MFSVIFTDLYILQALQAPACHENMVKVGGYILGEFGNLIAGDPRSRYVRKKPVQNNFYSGMQIF